MTSALHFKFKSAKQFETLTFDGDFIKVADLKLAIVERKGLNFGEGFDLDIKDAQTGEQFSDESTLVPKNTSVEVRRVPGLRPGGVLSNTAMARKNERYTDGGVRDSMSRGKVNSPNGDTDTHTVEGADEADRIASVLDQAASAFGNSTNGYAAGGQYRGFARGQSGMGVTGGHGSAGFMADRPPRPGPNYLCHRCMKPGHWIDQCPTNGDPSFDRIKVRAPTGIPRSMLRTVDAPETGTGLKDSSGQFVALQPNEAEFARQTVGLRMSQAAARKMEQGVLGKESPSNSSSDVLQVNNSKALEPEAPSTEIADSTSLVNGTAPPNGSVISHVPSHTLDVGGLASAVDHMPLPVQNQAHAYSASNPDLMLDGNDSHSNVATGTQPIEHESRGTTHNRQTQVIAGVPNVNVDPGGQKRNSENTASTHGVSSSRRNRFSYCSAGNDTASALEVNVSDRPSLGSGNFMTPNSVPQVPFGFPGAFFHPGMFPHGMIPPPGVMPPGMFPGVPPVLPPGMPMLPSGVFPPGLLPPHGLFPANIPHGPVPVPPNNVFAEDADNSLIGEMPKAGVMSQRCTNAAEEIETKEDHIESGQPRYLSDESPGDEVVALEVADSHADLQKFDSERNQEQSCSDLERGTSNDERQLMPEGDSVRGRDDFETRKSNSSVHSHDNRSSADARNVLESDLRRVNESSRNSDSETFMRHGDEYDDALHKQRTISSRNRDVTASFDPNGKDDSYKVIDSGEGTRRRRDGTRRTNRWNESRVEERHEKSTASLDRPRSSSRDFERSQGNDESHNSRMKSAHREDRDRFAENGSELDHSLNREIEESGRRRDRRSEEYYEREKTRERSKRDKEREDDGVHQGRPVDGHDGRSSQRSVRTIDAEPESGSQGRRASDTPLDKAEDRSLHRGDRPKEYRAADDQHSRRHRVSRDQERSSDARLDDNVRSKRHCKGYGRADEWESNHSVLDHRTQMKDRWDSNTESERHRLRHADDKGEERERRNDSKKLSRGYGSKDDVPEKGFGDYASRSRLPPSEDYFDERRYRDKYGETRNDLDHDADGRSLYSSTRHEEDREHDGRDRRDRSRYERRDRKFADEDDVQGRRAYVPRRARGNYEDDHRRAEEPGGAESRDRKSFKRDRGSTIPDDTDYSTTAKRLRRDRFHDRPDSQEPRSNYLAPTKKHVIQRSGRERRDEREERISVLHRLGQRKSVHDRLG